MERPKLTKEQFKNLANVIADIYGKSAGGFRFHADSTNMTTAEFIEQTKQYDAQMATLIQAWADAGEAMGEYIRSRIEK